MSALKDHELKSPVTLKEALQILGQQPGAWKLFAGGTDLMWDLETTKLEHKKYLDLNSIPELKDIAVQEEDILIGAGATLSQIRNHPILQRELPMLAQAAKVMGPMTVQNRGTLGGNIASMNPQAGLPPALLAYDTDIILLSSSGYRVQSYKYFHKDLKVCDLRPNEIIMAVRLRRAQGFTHSYYKKAEITLAATACVFRGQKIEWAQIAFGGLGPVPLRMRKTEHFLFEKQITPEILEEAKNILTAEVSHMTSDSPLNEKDRALSAVLLSEFLMGLKS